MSEYNSLKLAKYLDRDHVYVKRWIKKQDKPYSNTVYVYNKKECELLCLSEEVYELFKNTYPLTKKATKWNIESINVWLLENKPNIKMISKEYKRSKSSMDWYCLEHKRDFKTSWEAIQSCSYGCSYCAQNAQYTYEDTLNTIKALDLVEILDSKKETFINSESTMLVRCKIDGYEWEGPAHKLIKGRGCNRCSKKEQYTYDTMCAKVHSLIPVHILTKELQYTNNVQSKITVQCKLDGHIWNPSPDGIFSGGGCPICGLRRKSYFNATIAKREEDSWSKKFCHLYIIECSNNSELFIKIGVTGRKIKHRFSGKNMPYVYKIVKDIKTTRYDALIIEDILHNKFKDAQYSPNMLFAGYTECFNHTIKQELESINYDMLIKYKLND